MKLLFLTSRFPYPLEKGDKLRAYHLIKSLSRHVDIYLFAINDQEPDEESIAKLRPYCKAIETVIISKIDSLAAMIRAIGNTNLPFQVAYFQKEEAKQQLRHFIKEHQPDALFCHLIRMAEYATELTIHPSIIDYMDTFSIGMKRMEKDTNLLFKLPFKIEAGRLAKYEAETFNNFDHHLIISEQDRNSIPHSENKKIEIVANGVDFDYYIPTSLEKKFDLLFLGNMSYPPNISSSIYAARKILPALHKIKPDAKLVIAGANPTSKVKNLANEFVSVSGWVDDPLILFNEARVMVAPMLISIGLQNKILQAMAMKLPCVISTLANNAICAPVNECVMVADTPEEYAIKINQLLTDEPLRMRIAENAYNFVLSNFNWDRNTAKIISLLNINSSK